MKEVTTEWSNERNAFKVLINTDDTVYNGLNVGAVVYSDNWWEILRIINIVNPDYIFIQK